MQLIDIHIIMFLKTNQSPINFNEHYYMHNDLHHKYERYKNVVFNETISIVNLANIFKYQN